MKKEKGYILKRIADEYNIFPCGEKAEETQEVLTLSESAAWIYEHVEEADSVKVLAELLSEEYGIRAEEVLQDVQEVIDFLQENRVQSRQKFHVRCVLQDRDDL